VQRAARALTAAADTVNMLIYAPQHRQGRPRLQLANNMKPDKPGTGPSSRTRPFARSLPMQLMRARELVMRHFRPHLHEHDLTDQQWRIIRALMEADAIEIGDLSERCCIHPASLSRILPKLETSGLVSRRGNADDKRRVMVAIAPQGRRLFNSMAPESAASYAAIARKLGAKRLHDTYRVLDELIVALGDRRSDAPPARPGKARADGGAKK
jgi:homoprotocatechuate degradation regulator HpaR